MNSLDKILDTSYVSVNIDSLSKDILYYLYKFIDAECSRIGTISVDCMAKLWLATNHADQFKEDFDDQAQGNIFYWNDTLEMEEVMPVMLDALFIAETAIRRELSKGDERAYSEDSWSSWCLIAGMRNLDERLAVVSSKEACSTMQKLIQEMGDAPDCGDAIYGVFDHLHDNILSSIEEDKKPPLAA